MSKQNKRIWCYIKYNHIEYAFKREFYQLNSYRKLINEIIIDNVIMPSHISEIYYIDTESNKHIIKDDQTLSNISPRQSLILYISLKSQTCIKSSIKHPAVGLDVPPEPYFPMYKSNLNPVNDS